MQRAGCLLNGQYRVYPPSFVNCSHSRTACRVRLLQSNASIPFTGCTMARCGYYSWENGTAFTEKEYGMVNGSLPAVGLLVCRGQNMRGAQTTILSAHADIAILRALYLPLDSSPAFKCT